MSTQKSKKYWKAINRNGMNYESPFQKGTGLL